MIQEYLSHKEKNKPVWKTYVLFQLENKFEKSSLEQSTEDLPSSRPENDAGELFALQFHAFNFCYSKLQELLSWTITYKYGKFLKGQQKTR